MPLNNPEAYTGSGSDPLRGSIQEMFDRPYTFDALQGQGSIPDFEVSRMTETFEKNTMYVDLETTGLRTKSFSALSSGPRETLPGIMEMATFYRPSGRTTARPVPELTGYSDVIPRNVLDNINDEVLEGLTQKEQHGLGSRVDEGVLQEGKLRDIFMDYAEASKTGKYPQTEIPANFRGVEDYIQGFADTMDLASRGNGGVITGWNISFDMNMIMDTAKSLDEQKGTNYSTKMTNLIESGKVQVKDLDAPLRKYMFHQAMSGTGTPEHLSRKSINQALQAAGDQLDSVRQEILDDVGMHGVPDPNTGEVMRSRFVGTNDPLVELGQDVRAAEIHSGDEAVDVFRRRLTAGAEASGGITPTRADAIEKIAQELSTVANAVPGDERYSAYQGMQRNVREMIRNAESSVESKALRDVVSHGYGQPGQSLLGAIEHTDSHLPWQTLDDLTSGLDFVGGRTQDIIAQQLGHPMASSAHVAMADIPMGSEMSSRLEEMVDLALGGDAEASQRLDDMIAESKRMRFEEVANDVLQQDRITTETVSNIGAAQQSVAQTSGLGAKMKSALGKVGGWKGGLAIGALGYLAHDLFTDSPQVEGMRQAYSQYDQGHGIAPTGDPTLTPYGSGRDSNYQLQKTLLDKKKDISRGYRRQTLSAGREATHAALNPITHDTVANDATRRLRGSIESAAGYKFVEKTVLPEAPASRPDIALSYYNMDAQTRFSQNVQSNSHASIEEHPDHDHRPAGIGDKKIASPKLSFEKKPPGEARPVEVERPKTSLSQKSVSNLSHDAQPSTIKGVAGPVGMAPPQVNMPSSHKGKSKVRDQGAKHFALPSNNKSTINKSRAIRGGGQE